jgi:hypothetical protein
MKLMSKKMSRSNLITVLLVLSFIMPAGAAYAANPGTSVLISPSLLDQAQLKLNWQFNLPIKQSENVDRLFIFGKYLYVLTDRNYLFCMDRVKGSMRFDLQLAPAGLPIGRPDYYDGKLWLIVGKELIVLNPLTGAIIEKRTIETIGKYAVCGPVRNSENIFIAGVDKRLHAIVADEYWHRFMVTADNDSLITSMAVDDSLVVFTTEAGNIVCIRAQGPEKLWQFDISGPITAPVVRDDDWLYVGGEDTKLYKLNIRTGKAGWDASFQAQQPLLESAQLSWDIVYQYAGDKGLYAVDKTSGKKLWQVPEGIGLLTEIGSKAYVLAEPGELVVMDNNTGKKLFSVNFAPVTRFTTNLLDPVIYISDNKGRIASIAQIEQ